MPRIVVDRKQAASYFTWRKVPDYWRETISSIVQPISTFT